MFVWLLGHKVTHPSSGRPPSASGLGGANSVHVCATWDSAWMESTVRAKAQFARGLDPLTQRAS